MSVSLKKGVKKQLRVEGGQDITPGLGQRCDFEWNSAQQQLFNCNTSGLFVLS